MDQVGNSLLNFVFITLPTKKKKVVYTVEAFLANSRDLKTVPEMKTKCPLEMWMMGYFNYRGKQCGQFLRELKVELIDPAATLLCSIPTHVKSVHWRDGPVIDEEMI